MTSDTMHAAPAAPVLHLVTLTYQRPADEVSQHVGAHWEHVCAAAREGLLVVAGPRVDRRGGVLLATGPLAAVEAMVARDPFITSGVAAAEIHPFRATTLPGWWPADASSEAQEGARS